MTNSRTPGLKFRQAVKEEKPLQVMGTINAYTALMAEKIGYKSIYLSGSGVACASYGLPDLGITHLGDVVEDIARITNTTSVPLLVDADTGWGSAFNIARTVKLFEKNGAAALHLEDQEQAKRCGHRPGKAIVSLAEMVDRIKAAVDARTDESFVIMARTDALASEGMEKTLERIQAYIEAGADMLFPEAMATLEEYKMVVDTASIPVLANLTEFGKTPLFTLEQLDQVGVSMALYPLTAFRAMNAAAEHVYKTVRKDGTQKKLIDCMQTRDTLYEYLDYYQYEQKLDKLFQSK